MPNYRRSAITIIKVIDTKMSSKANMGFHLQTLQTLEDEVKIDPINFINFLYK